MQLDPLPGLIWLVVICIALLWADYGLAYWENHKATKRLDQSNTVKERFRDRRLQ